MFDALLDSADDEERVEGITALAKVVKGYFNSGCQNFPQRPIYWLATSSLIIKTQNSKRGRELPIRP